MVGRTDLEKYDMSVAEAENFFVDYRGGLSNRGGTELVDILPAKVGTDNCKMVPFKFAPAVTSTYEILIGYYSASTTAAPGFIRFIQDGAYVLESTTKTITGITTGASTVTITSAAHGYANGDLIRPTGILGTVELNGQSFIVSDVTANTFKIRWPNGVYVDGTSLTAYSSAGTLYRAYTLSHSFANADIPSIKFHQSRAVIYLTHKNYAPKKLTRISDTNWTLADVSFAPNLATPGAPTITPSAAGTAGVAFAVTAVDKYGSESLISPYGFNALCANYPSVGGSVKVTWTAVANAIYYRVYRTQVIPVGADLTRAMEVGFVGIAYGPEFTDNNIIPDFTDTPPVYYNPFANGAVEYIQVTAGGAGYTRASTVSLSGGTGFVGYPVVSSAGVLLGIVIINGGSGYTTGSTVTVTVGAGATFSVSVTPSSGNNPRVSSVFQQRKVYAGFENDPLTVVGSKTGLYDDMDTSQVVSDSDSYEFELDSEEVSPIEWLSPSRAGMVLWSQSGLWKLTGSNADAITPQNAIADPQSYGGIRSDIPPLPIGTDILYAEAKSNTVRLLQYSDLTKVFAGQDLSLLANHLITSSNKIVSWDYAADPFKLIYCVREDGSIAVLALVRDQNVFGWSRFTTAGLYKQVSVLKEGDIDRVYTIAQRKIIGGADAYVIERSIPRSFDSVEDAWFLDAGLNLAVTTPDANLINLPNLTLSSSGSVTVSGGTYAPGAGDIGKVIRCNGGKFLVTAYNAGVYTIQCLRRMTGYTPETTDGTDTLYIPSGKWTLDAEVSSVSGLLPYAGLTVKVFADGDVVPDAVVSAKGVVTLPAPASRVVIGFGYTAFAKPLPPTSTQVSLEGKLKKPVGATVRVFDTRGLAFGPSRTDLSKSVEFKDRQFELLGEPTNLRGGARKIIFANMPYDLEGQYYAIQQYPLPVTLLSLVTNLEIGDADGG